jgi:hypothetical protein
MNQKGFGLLSMFGLLIVFAICLCLSAYFYTKNFQKDEKESVYSIPESTETKENTTMKSAYDYSILEERLKLAASQYLKENDLTESASLIIPVSDLIESKFLSNFYDLEDNKTLCTGYVMYQNKEIIPYVWCKGNYATEGYNTSLK